MTSTHTTANHATPSAGCHVERKLFTPQIQWIDGKNRYRIVGSASLGDYATDWYPTEEDAWSQVGRDFGARS